ncbi:MAG: hypothetical protein DSY81_11735 [Bacillota bacterium]|nr:MAG: hypothetical protein DSY81_11735 [Bacillota bacterium]
MQWRNCNLIQTIYGEVKSSFFTMNSQCRLLRKIGAGIFERDDDRRNPQIPSGNLPLHFDLDRNRTVASAIVFEDRLDIPVGQHRDGGQKSIGSGDPLQCQVLTLLDALFVFIAHRYFESS